MNHSFNVNIATDFSINTALFIGHLEHWTFKNLANNRNIHDGLCWSFDTLDAMGDIFPYWTRRQRERVINNAVKEGLVTRSNYNQTKYDRTVWYALTPKAYGYFPHLLKPKFLENLYLSISPNGEMDFAEWRNGFPHMVTTIPDTIPVTDPNIKSVGDEPSQHTVLTFPTKNETHKKAALEDKEAKEFFDTKFAGLQVTYEQLFNDCTEHYDSKRQWVTVKKWKLWLEREKLDNYSKESAKTKKPPVNETDKQRQERQFFENELRKEREMPGYISKDLEKYPEFREKYA